MAIDIKDQAVILIHGIGEQKPMDTLRSFVKAVLEKPDSGAQYWSKPDRMSELFELRKLQNRTQPRTHFFEYYWAYKVEGTKLGHVLSWVQALLFRKPGNVPEHLRFVWWLSWTGITIILAGVIIAIFLGIFSDLSGSIQSIPWAVSAVLTAVLGFIEGSLKDSLGDAARYLSPTPKNIALRRAIRTDGINLLRKIHESGKYDRVIIVGHSLGSVIAYDIIKHVWYDYNRKYEKPAKHNQEGIKRIEIAGEALKSDPDNEEKLRKFQEAQIGLWRELRELGNPWLVTDFVTLGSPLAHGFLLLAKDREEFKARCNEREFTLCPPKADEPGEGKKGKGMGYSFRDYWNPYEVEGEKVVLKALHSAAPFACTRWTNLYFPAILGLCGDMVGGPVRNWFGPGIKDIKVKLNGLAQYTLVAHSSYWRKREIKDGTASLPALIQALDIEGEHTFK